MNFLKTKYTNGLKIFKGTFTYKLRTFSQGFAMSTFETFGSGQGTFFSVHYLSNIAVQEAAKMHIYSSLGLMCNLKLMFVISFGKQILLFLYFYLRNHSIKSSRLSELMVHFAWLLGSSKNQ